MLGFKFRLGLRIGKRSSFGMRFRLVVSIGKWRLDSAMRLMLYCDKNVINDRNYTGVRMSIRFSNS